MVSALKEQILSFKGRLHFWKGYKIGKPNRARLLVYVLLKFQMLISQICQYFLSKKLESAKASFIFFNKNVSVFGYKVVKHLISLPFQELIKLTML